MVVGQSFGRKGENLKIFRLRLALSLTMDISPTQMKTLIPVANFLLLLGSSNFAHAASHAKQISKTQAEQIALQKVPNGKIENSELQTAHRKQFWSVDVARPGAKNGKEVHIDAMTGKILKVSTEKPGDRAEEGLKH